MRQTDRDIALVYELSDEKIELDEEQKYKGGRHLVSAGMRLGASREDMKLILQITGCMETPEPEEEESA